METLEIRFEKLERQVGREVENLTAAIKAGGPIERLVKELKACEERKALLRAEKRQVEGDQLSPVPEVTKEDIEAGLKHLNTTLEYAAPEERKAMLREHIRSIEVPKKGAALLEADPAGLLSSSDLRVLGDPEGSRTKCKTRGECIRIGCVEKICVYFLEQSMPGALIRPSQVYV